MSKKANSFDVKINVIRAWENRTHTITDLGHINNVSPSTIYNWIDRYESLGEKGLHPTSKEYSKEYKLKVVHEYLKGGTLKKNLLGSMKFQVNLSSKNGLRIIIVIES
ncbi:helix-turn-helix domain-containing protein [Sutcliffiella horikoshii]|uniref:Helix-turn-helix domain-containing protein n=1 Tax=Sutcliffiella horikoshii TaxID=79883 RepID=A0AA95B705_9BACI|nr:helix-turn-helix domain-containing protein [Sutcliffiella horikoshii]TYS58752.1 helix-turn-helix domain-containing protein [Sutcliffiella horikoshii]